MGTNKIEAILVNLPDQNDLICLHPEAFAKMKRLRIFINYNARFSGGPNYLSNELRVFDWWHYPSRSLPSNFNGNKLVVFRMHNSLIKELGERRFKQLQEIPQLPPKLEVLSARGCTSLESFSQLSKIWQFNTSDLQELKWVELTGCHKMVVDVENSVPKALLFQGYPTGHDSVYKDSTFSVIFPGNISALYPKDISGMALYIVFGPICGIHDEDDGKLGIFVNMAACMMKVVISIVARSVDVDHVWLKHIGTYHIESNYGRVRVYNRTTSMIIKSCGFYLVYKHDQEVATYAADMLHEDVDVTLEVPEKEWKNSRHIMDGVQISKKRRIDDDRN
ncbi:putative WRKY transcription factor 52 [Morella rubra]|uniref:Putative WRKY transcription factor 52 n=1 Tax=Morella rubra TaxID=262757 RepID=A0A6A1UJV5_9ROSI|nr:putative WRKY transcription factor 52 [Morella rubra]